MQKINLSYEWLSLVERQQGEAVKAAANELGKWAKGPGLLKKVAEEAELIAYIIWVFMPEEEEEYFMDEMTNRQRFLEWWPVEGQALIYVFQISVDLRVEVLSKIDELFDRHGVLVIWWAIRREGYRLLREAWN
jgi:hypothetical protein